MSDEKRDIKSLLGANLENVRAMRNIERVDAERGTRGGAAAGRLADVNGQALQGPDVAVLRDVQTTGVSQVHTVVWYTRPADGHVFYLEIDVFPYSKADIKPMTLENGDIIPTIPFGRIHSFSLICPRCGPSAPKYGPRAAQGQLMLYGDTTYPWFDEKGKFSVQERIKCGWTCGWHVQIAEGRAYPVKGLRNLFSKVSWFH